MYHNQIVIFRWTIPLSQSAIPSPSRSFSFASGSWINCTSFKLLCCVLPCLQVLPNCPYQRCHDPVWLDAPGQAGTPQQAHGGQLWLLLTIIYGPLWLKTWELEIERLVRSQGTTLRYKTEAAAAVRSRTPAKLCRPSAHPDKHKLSFCSLFSSFIFSFLLFFPWL